MGAVWRRRRADEAGFSLVELIVYSLLMIVVLGLAGAAFIQMLISQRDITAMADASNEQQLAFQQLELDLRNADWVEVRHGGTLLVMRTRVATTGSPDVSRCVGYFYSAADEELRRVSTTVSATTADAVAAGNAGAVESLSGSWQVVVHGAEPFGGAPVFGPFDSSFDDPEIVSLSLAANTIDGRKPIEFVKSISLRPQGNLGAGCR